MNNTTKKLMKEICGWGEGRKSCRWDCYDLVLGDNGLVKGEIVIFILGKTRGTISFKW